MSEPELKHQESTKSLTSASNMRSTVFFLALPILGEQVLTFLVSFYDVFLAGHLHESINTDATAAVGVAAYVGWLASMMFSLVATGTTALVARAWGANDVEHARQVMNRSIALAFGVGLLFMIAVQISAPSIVALMGLKANAQAISARYLRIESVSLVFNSLAVVISAALRGTGDMRTPMWVYSGVNILNILISTALVYGVGPVEPWGVDGIVTGTLVSRMLGGLFLFGLLLRGVSGLKAEWSELHFGGESVQRILSIGAPAAYEGMLNWAGQVVFLRIISQCGEAAFAAHMVGVRVEALAYLPAIAWGSAAATMVGQSLGANQPERALQSGHEAVKQCAFVGVSTMLLFTFGASLIYTIMHNDPEVRALGAQAFPLVGLAQVPQILSIVYFFAMRGAGETKFALWTTLCATYLIRIPLGYFFGIHLGLGLLGAWIGMSLDMCFRGVASVWKYRTESWLKNESLKLPT